MRPRSRRHAPNGARSGRGRPGISPSRRGRGGCSGRRCDRRDWRTKPAEGLLLSHIIRPVPIAVAGEKRGRAEHKRCGQRQNKFHGRGPRYCLTDWANAAAARKVVAARKSASALSESSGKTTVNETSGKGNASRPVSRVLSGADLRLRDGHSSGTSVAGRLKQPTRVAGSEDEPRARFPRTRPPLFGLAPGGVCRAAPVASRAVRSYRTVSPLPRRANAAGGLFSVALSLGSPPAAVSRHPVSWSPDFPPPALFRWAITPETGSGRPAG